MKPSEFYKRTDDVPIGELIKTKSGKVYEVKPVDIDSYDDECVLCGFEVLKKKCCQAFCYGEERADDTDVYFSRRTDLED